MPVRPDKTSVVDSIQLERSRQAIDLVGHLLAAGIRLENRVKAVPRLRIGLFEERVR
jgi:hypothetical protein